MRRGEGFVILRYGLAMTLSMKGISGTMTSEPGIKKENYIIKLYILIVRTWLNVFIEHESGS